MLISLPVLKRICFPHSLKKLLPLYGNIHWTISKNVNCICNYHSNVRVRFAPSPTGTLHLGGLRTVLYNYAFARSQNGKFLLRIEDTDQARFVPGAVENLLEMLKWLGITPDEGPFCGGDFGPYIQSQRLHVYQEGIKTLLEKDCAYYCFCTERRLSLMRKEAVKRRGKVGYDNLCRSLTAAEVKRNFAEKIPYVIRFKVPSETVTFQDMVIGSSSVNLSQLEGDPVLIKSDGFPTYHFANVLDDHYMKITHVLRGMEWHVSTVKHILLYKALGYEPPQFAHLPLLMNSDGTKLSKRQGDIGVEDYKNKGYYPETILNILASVGGGFQHQDETVMSLEELVNSFCIEEINAKPSKLNFSTLDHYNRTCIKQKLNNKEGKELLTSELRSLILQKFKDRLTENELQQKILENKFLTKILIWSTDRIYTIHDLVKDDFEYLWVIPSTFDLSEIPVTNTQAAKILSDLHSSLPEKINDNFSHKSINQFFREFAQKNEIQYKTFMKLLRICLSNLKKGPGIDEMMEVLGKESTLERILYAQSWLLKNKIK